MRIKYGSLLSAILISITSIVSLPGCTPAATTQTPQVIQTPATVNSSAPVVKPGAAPVVTPVTTPVGSPIVTPATQPVQGPKITLLVSAAASLSDALKEVDAAYTAVKPNVTVVANFGSSGTLQTQIQNGAPVDVFISAAATQMDNLQKGQLLIDDTRKDLLNNRVVLIVPLDSTLNITGFTDLALDKVKKIAIGDPKSVPAGTYGLQTFDELGITAKVTPKEVLGADVRQVLTYVEGGNVDAGIVYSTDAMTSTKVKVVATAPADINAKVVYPAAVIRVSKIPDTAKDYVTFLSSPAAKAIFEKYGFTMVMN